MLRGRRGRRAHFRGGGRGEIVGFGGYSLLCEWMEGWMVMYGFDGSAMEDVL